MMVPFKVGDLAGLRLVRVVPGVAAQFTDGPKDTLEATEQAHLVIAAASGGPAESRDRDQFARDAMSGLPPFKDMRIVNAEPMRIGGQPGLRGAGAGQGCRKPAPTSRSCNGCGSAPAPICASWASRPKDKWTDTFTRFRAIRDGLEPR